jgi:hypothetical protein
MLYAPHGPVHVIDLVLDEIIEHPVVHLGGDVLGPRVRPAPLLRVYDVKPLLCLGIQCRYIGWIILQVTIHDDDVAPTRAVQPRRDGRMLPEIAAQPDAAHSRLHLAIGKDPLP